jgi:hypothetical protein
MNYFEFVQNIIENFRVSKMIETIRVNNDEEGLLATSYESTKSLVIVANYKQSLNIETPKYQGISQLDFLKQIINLGNGAEKTSVKFKENDEGYAIETIFKIDNANIKYKNTAKALLPDVPKNLEGFKKDFEVELNEEEINNILRHLRLNIQNASVYLLNSNGHFSFVLTNDIDEVVYETEFEIDAEILKEPFKIELDKLLSILKIGQQGVKLSVAEEQHLVRIVKEDDIAMYRYFMVRRI